MKATVLVALLLGATVPARGDCFIRGDSNADGKVDISDDLFTLSSLFIDGIEAVCADAQDANDDGILDLSDPIFMLSWRYLGVGVMPAPYPDCGRDPSDDRLDCAQGACRDGPAAVPDRVFVLETARVGLPYRADLPACFQEEILVFPSRGPPETLREAIPFRGYCSRSGDLPAGLEIDEDGGALSGIPEEPGFFSLHLSAFASSGEVVRVRADIAVFGEAEDEIAPDRTVGEPGPHRVGVLASAFEYEHLALPPPPYDPWDCMVGDLPDEGYRESKDLRIYYPVDGVGPDPAIIFHHGFGFSHRAYESLLGHLASHGFVAATVEDGRSYGSWAILCGVAQEEAARVMLAAREAIAKLSSDPGSPLSGKIDVSRVFYGGHSRGGGSALIAGELDPAASGVIALQPTDPKEDAWIANTSRMDLLPEIPVLIVTAEQDADVTFPLAERIFERVRGAGTLVSIYGACHGFTADGTVWCPSCDYAQDVDAVDICPYISRRLHQELTGKFVTAFLRRHALGDLSFEGMLYGDEFARSPLLSVASRRNLGSAIVVDDFGRFPVNSLGLPTEWSGVGDFTVSAGSSYDGPGGSPPEPFPPIDDLVLGLPIEGVFSYRSILGAPGAGLDVKPRRRLLFRIQNADRHRLVDNAGFGWLDISATLTDAGGDSATIPLDDRLPAEPYHPDPDPPEIRALLKYQRPITVSVPLAEFVRANRDLDLDRLLSLELRFVTAGSPAARPRVGIDDIRFE